MKTNLPSTEILSSSEIQLHYKRPLFSLMKHIKCSEDAEMILREFTDVNRIDLKEFFWVLFLTNANRLIGISEVASGSSDHVAISVKEVIQLSLITNASAIILAHNHPSGKTGVSKSDSIITQKLKELTSLFGITLLDHIIITSETYGSFSDSQWL